MKYILLVFLLLSSLFSNDDVFSKFEDLKNEEKYFEDGKKYYKMGDYTKAYENFKKSADYGNQKALYNLGILYSNKKFIYKDQNKAFEIFSNLARDNYSPALNRMGMYYSLGVIVEKDYKKAVDFYERASKQGYITAQCNLAMMYASGKGVFQNYGRAHAFAKEGYKQNHPICIRVWEDYNLEKHPEDKGFKFNFYTKP